MPWVSAFAGTTIRMAGTVFTRPEAGAYVWHGSRPFERVNESKMLSFRGAGAAREPGTHEHRTAKILEMQLFLDSGSALRTAPE